MNSVSYKPSHLLVEYFTWVSVKMRTFPMAVIMGFCIINPYPVENGPDVF